MSQPESNEQRTKLGTVLSQVGDRRVIASERGFLCQVRVGDEWRSLVLMPPDADGNWKGWLGKGA